MLVVVAAAAGVGAAVPKAVPKEKPPVLAAGALVRKTHIHNIITGIQRTK